MKRFGHRRGSRAGARALLLGVLVAAAAPGLSVHRAAHAAEPGTRAVPPAGADTAVVTVRVGGDRTGTQTVGPLAGVRLGLYARASAQEPLNDTWALCTSDSDGDCSFVVPDTQAGGANRDMRYLVRQLPDGVPAGWYTNPTLRTGHGNGSDSEATVYQFPTPALRAGNTYSSTSDFMIETAQVRTASGGIWQQSRTNPGLPVKCGIDVALVLDLSRSVGSNLPNLKRTADVFVDALTGTPSRMAVFSFSGDSPSAGTENHPQLTPVSTTAGAEAVKNLYADWPLGAGTNWDQALWAVGQAAPTYDMAVVITDGNPTRYSQPPQGDGTHTRFREVENGIFSANAVKAKGTRVLAVGVGSGISGISGLNLRALSGTTAFDGTNVEAADYYQTTDFAAAGAALRELVERHCAGSLSVVKQLVPADNTGEDVTGATPAGPGWQFTGTTSTPGVGGLPVTETTQDDGTGSVNFDLTYPAGTPQADVTVRESQQAGYELVTQGGRNAVCTNLTDDSPVPVTNSGATGEPGFTADVPRDAAVSCTVYNRPAGSVDVTVNKKWVINGSAYDEGDQPEGFDADLTLTGPGAAGRSHQDWGSPRPGYQAGATTTVEETVTLKDSTCRLHHSRVTMANTQALDAELPYSAELTEPHNVYTVVNVVKCRPTLPSTGSPTATLLALGLLLLVTGGVVTVWEYRTRHDVA